ncbi:hypothetical protein GCM10010112_86760 [Actinoplanes lobatus]|uniref:DUF4352 domain-containing protein n=1 Tax=Actinoplanes lobatus TaxID=113568 RepID=A0A7W7MEY8_9ACTN|nr:DUF4352 domain-containing protein [Actinoplanes lobatus]MBB4747784.1 hypothetical protein [Actinoplanes lobatus]GGN95951.1 hypothetical protein GCM10010112_86760 [Actinoplanes lobatus]GIE45140.1 hypothetical protein Alo02nite_80380 [Actinoplanes lobatus]
MTYAPHRSAPARDLPSIEDDWDAGPHRWGSRAWVTGGIGVSAVLVAFGAWAVATSPAATVTGVLAGEPPTAQFTVAPTGLRCGVPSVGPSDLEQRATGQFCLLDVIVTNNGREPELFDSGAQRVQDANGEAYAVAEQAAVFLNDRSPALLDRIGPGQTVAGVLPFDVPADARLSAAILGGGRSTPGVRVALPDPS